MIDKFNKWYDALKEPWRFLFAMSLIMTGIVTINIGSATHHYKLEAVGFVYLILLVIVRMVGRYKNASA